MAAILAFAGCGEAGQPLPGVSPSPSASAQPALSADAKVIFLHHSTGGYVYGVGGGYQSWSGVEAALASHNTTAGTSYAISNENFPTGAYSNGWSNYPYDYWYLWVKENRSTDTGERTLEWLTANHQVVVFKHCYPVCEIDPDSASPAVDSAAKTLANYKLQYAALKAKLRGYADTRFIVWTGAVEQGLDSARAARMKEFVDWVRNDWDEAGDNIYLWDFYALEVEGSADGRTLNPDHAMNGGDDHPNQAFAQETAPLFVKRLTDVMEGRGDSGSLTGR
jgi:hypothetical protein